MEQVKPREFMVKEAILKLAFHDPRPRPCVVVVGNIFGPKEVFGPFGDISFAEKWILLQKFKQHFEVVKLKSPD